MTLRARRSAAVANNPGIPPVVQEPLQTPLPKIPGPWAARPTNAATALKQSGLLTKAEFYGSLGLQPIWEYKKKGTTEVVGSLDSQMGGGGGRKRKLDEAQCDLQRDLSCAA